MENPINGIILIDKQEGIVSYSVVKKVKSALKRLGVKKVGHAGTLDPFATGLLVILIGQGTKLSNYLMSGTKKYVAEMKLGIETDTLDHTGKIINSCNVPEFDFSHIQNTAAGFVGEIDQKPPDFSALKYNGTRAYELARKGLEVNLDSRKRIIRSLKIISADLPYVKMEVECSSGTYIRSLAADIGRKLGVYATLTTLRRVSSGSFSVAEALNSSAIDDNSSILAKNIIPLDDAMPDTEILDITDDIAQKVKQGCLPDYRKLPGWNKTIEYTDKIIKLVNKGKLVAIVKVNTNGGNEYDKLKLQRVFN